jgi:hypothetical protein
MREFVIKRLRRARVIEPLWDKFERMAAARGTAFAEQDAAAAARDAVLVQQECQLNEQAYQQPRAEPAAGLPPHHAGQPAEISFADLADDLDPAMLPRLDRPDIDEAALTPEQRNWRRDGVLVLHGFLPSKLIDAYVERRAQHPDPGGWQVPTPYLHVPEMRALALYPPLLATLESLIGEPMMLHLALTGWVSTERTWHQDDYLNPAHVAGWYLAVWMALDDIHPDSGPFEYVPGSHGWPTLRRDKVISFLTEEEHSQRSPRPGLDHWPSLSERFVTPAVDRQICESGLPIRSFLGRKGDVLIWSGRLMHRGSMPRVPGMPRRSLITHYTGVNHRPDMPERARDVGGGVYALFDHELF